MSHLPYNPGSCLAPLRVRSVYLRSIQTYIVHVIAQLLFSQCFSPQVLWKSSDWTTTRPTSESLFKTSVVSGGLPFFAGSPTWLNLDNVFSLLLIVHVIGAELTLTFHSFFSSNSLIQLYWVVAYRDSGMSLSSFQKNSNWALFFKKSTWTRPFVNRWSSHHFQVGVGSYLWEF